MNGNSLVGVFQQSAFVLVFGKVMLIGTKCPGMNKPTYSGINELIPRRQAEAFCYLCSKVSSRTGSDQQKSYHSITSSLNLLSH